MLQTQAAGLEFPSVVTLSRSVQNKYVSPLTDTLRSYLGSEAAAPSRSLLPHHVFGRSWMYFVPSVPSLCSSSLLTDRPRSPSSRVGKEGHVS